MVATAAILKFMVLLQEEIDKQWPRRSEKL